MRLLICSLALSIAACSPVFKLSTRQGNVIDQDKLDQVETGMTREQVRYLMGTPLLAEEFQPQRWDYVSYYRTGAGREIKRIVSLYFDGDELARIEDSKPAVAEPEGESVDPSPDNEA